MFKYILFRVSLTINFYSNFTEVWSWEFNSQYLYVIINSGNGLCLHSTKGIYAQKHLYQMVAERSSKHSWTILTVLGASWRKKWLYWKKWFLWVILPEGDPPDNMAMRLNPPDLSKCRTYERYRQELKAWQEVTDIPKTKQGIAIALSLPQDSGESGIREKVFDEIELKDLKKENGLEILISHFCCQWTQWRRLRLS